MVKFGRIADIGDLFKRSKNVKKVETATEDIGGITKALKRFRGGGDKISDVTKKVGKGVKTIYKNSIGAAMAVFSAVRLLAIASIVSDIRGTLSGDHPWALVVTLAPIILGFLYLIISKIYSSSKKVGELVSSAKNRFTFTGGGGSKKLSDTVCFFILISFIFVINFLYEKYLELEKEKEKLYQYDYQITQNY